MMKITLYSYFIFFCPNLDISFLTSYSHTLSSETHVSKITKRVFRRFLLFQTIRQHKGSRSCPCATLSSLKNPSSRWRNQEFEGSSPEVIKYFLRLNIILIRLLKDMREMLIPMNRRNEESLN